MNISIIGAGPAGLYFACYLKSFRADFNITVFEAQHESMNAFGLGYTLQKLDTILLERLDADFYQHLFNKDLTPTITQALFKTNHQQRVLPFSEGFSVTRLNLLDYLMKKATVLGVNIITKKVTKKELPKLQKEFDLVIAADGISSIARDVYNKELQTEEHKAKLKFSWFTNETNQVRKEACFYAFNSKEGVTLLTSYPLTNTKQAVVIEMTDQCLASGDLQGKTPAQAIPYLNKLLSENSDDISLQPANLPWYTFKMNTAGKLYHNNLALMGDAAYSFHYSAGQGVTMSFSMAYTLVQCILKNDTLSDALAHYNHSIRSLLNEPAKKSQRHMTWFENIDQHFNNVSPNEWLDLFLEKDEHSSISKKKIQTCNSGTCR